MNFVIGLRPLTTILTEVPLRLVLLASKDHHFILHLPDNYIR